jgi:hypothetical protein
MNAAMHCVVYVRQVQERDVQCGYDSYFCGNLKMSAYRIGKLCGLSEKCRAGDSAKEIAGHRDGRCVALSGQ